MDFARTDPSGRGTINILAADCLMQTPKVYSTFLLWLLSELFERFPEAGDLEKPKLVFFFDEAHLLFQDTPKVLEERIVQVVRLIRSKGIGVYFVTQNPADIPVPVLGQLGNRVQHALRAFTPKDQKDVKGGRRNSSAEPCVRYVYRNHESPYRRSPDLDAGGKRKPRGRFPCPCLPASQPHDSAYTGRADPGNCHFVHA